MHGGWRSLMAQLLYVLLQGFISRLYVHRHWELDACRPCVCSLVCSALLQDLLDDRLVVLEQLAWDAKALLAELGAEKVLLVLLEPKYGQLVDLLFLDRNEQALQDGSLLLLLHEQVEALKRRRVLYLED